MADSALPPPADLETKSTKDVLIGYRPSQVPIETRTGTELSGTERKHADQVVGSPAQGNGVDNSNLASVGGLATDSGGTTTTPTVGESEQTPKVEKVKR